MQKPWLIPQDRDILLEETKKAIDEIRSQNRTLRPSGNQKFLTGWLDDVESQILLDGKVKPIDILDAKGTKISLNDDINWNVDAKGADLQLRRINKAIDKDIALYGQRSEAHKAWYEKLKKADEFYGTYLGQETGLASDTIKKILTHQDPERIILKLNKPSDFDVLDKFLSRTEEGKAFFDSIKREKLDSIFEKSFQAVQDEKSDVTWKSLSKNLSDPSKAVLIKKLAGDDVYKKLQSFAKYAEGMSNRFARNPGSSGTPHEGIILAIIAGAIGGDKGVASAVKGISKAVAFGPVLAWTVRSKRMMNIALNAAKASAEGNLKDVHKWGSMLDKSFLEEFGETAFKNLSHNAAHQSAAKEEKEEKSIKHPQNVADNR